MTRTHIATWTHLGASSPPNDTQRASRPVAATPSKRCHGCWNRHRIRRPLHTTVGVVSVEGAPPFFALLFFIIMRAPKRMPMPQSVPPTMLRMRPICFMSSSEPELDPPPTRPVAVCRPRPGRRRRARRPRRRRPCRLRLPPRGARPFNMAKQQSLSTKTDAAPAARPGGRRPPSTSGPPPLRGLVRAAAGRRSHGKEKEWRWTARRGRSWPWPS